MQSVWLLSAKKPQCQVGGYAAGRIQLVPVQSGLTVSGGCRAASIYEWKSAQPLALNIAGCHRSVQWSRRLYVLQRGGWKCITTPKQAGMLGFYILPQRSIRLYELHWEGLDGNGNMLHTGSKFHILVYSLALSRLNPGVLSRRSALVLSREQSAGKRFVQFEYISSFREVCEVDFRNRLNQFFCGFHLRGSLRIPLYCVLRCSRASQLKPKS